MNYFKQIIAAVLLSLTTVKVNGQLPTLPPSIKWQQINSAHFRIIFPKGYEDEANRTTNILENIYEPGSRSLGSKPRKFPVLLQNHHAISNGFVTVAPYRSEFFTFAPQDYNSLGNDRWLEHLASHEYRHIAQFEKAITPFTKAFYFLFGEYGSGFWGGVAAPSWFFEGDAVGTETAFGNTGRGRMPEFLMAYKANLIEKGGFNYYKQHLTSFRDFVPNHYVTGYLMTTHLKNEHGVDIWDKITYRSFHKPFIPFAFSNAIKKETDKGLLSTYQEMMDKQRQLYALQLSKISPSSFEVVNDTHRKNYTHYNFPNVMADGRIVALKYGFSDIKQFVILNQYGNEEKLFELGVHTDPGFLSANDSLIVWTEQTFDARWLKRSYGVIKTFNLYTEECKTLSKKTRYSAAAISPNSQWIVAISQSELGENRMHLINPITGEIIKEFNNPSNDFYSMPSFDDQSKKIIVLKHKDKGKQIIQKSIDSGLETEIHYSETENLGHPVQSGDFVFFNSNRTGVDNIFAIDSKSKELFQVTNSKYGAFNPSISDDSQEIYYNDYSVNGMNLVKCATESKNWISEKNILNVNFDFPKTMIENEGIQDILYHYPDSTYEVTKYPKLAKSFRPTGWGAVLMPTNNQIIGGLTSKDLLGTTTVNLLLNYSTNERTLRTSANLSYQALFPVLDFSANVGKRAVNLIDSDGNKENISWTENTFSGGFRLPFLLTNSKYNRNLEFGMSTSYRQIINNPLIDQPNRLNGTSNLYALNIKASYSRLLKRSLWDLNSRWGQKLTVTALQTPFGGDYQDRLYAAEGSLFFPWFFRHHSIELRGAYQYEDFQNYYFDSPVRFTRGYNYTPYKQFVNLSTNYKFPIAYMDWHLGPIINLQRVYTNLFMDQGMGIIPNRHDPYNFYSIGTEVSFNFNLMRYLILFDVGFRYSYKPEIEKSMYELIIGSITL